MTINNLFLEDLTIGQKFTSGIASVQEYLIQEFGSQYDPQPFHTNKELAKNTFFKGLVASGWHTAAITMRLLRDVPFILKSEAPPPPPPLY